MNKILKCDCGCCTCHLMKCPRCNSNFEKLKKCTLHNSSFLNYRNMYLLDFFSIFFCYECENHFMYNKHYKCYRKGLDLTGCNKEIANILDHGKMAICKIWNNDNTWYDTDIIRDYIRYAEKPYIGMHYKEGVHNVTLIKVY